MRLMTHKWNSGLIGRLRAIASFVNELTCYRVREQIQTAPRHRRWRSARGRGVSPIIATILLVAITVVLAAVLYVLISSLTHGSSQSTLGSAFGAGMARPPLVESTAGSPGCAPTHFCYVLSVASAGTGVSASSMNLIVKTGTGTTYVTGAAGGFTVYNIVTAAIVCTAVVGAGTPMSETTWAAGPGGTAMTQLSSQMTIVVDLGATTAPTGTGLELSAIGIGSYSGTVTIALP
jgi:flagellin-like protein